MDKIREMKAIGLDYEVTFYVDEADYQTFRLWEYEWKLKPGRNTVYIQNTKNSRKIILHRLILGLLGSPKTVVVDHIDHNGLNNCRSNLRITTLSGNQMNALKRSSRKNTSSFKGISKDKNGKSTINPWRARILGRHLGCFPTEMEAAKAYNKAAKELSDLCLLNDLSE
jgi:hypothetical protein